MTPQDTGQVKRDPPKAVIALRLSDKAIAELDALAESRDQTRSQYVRKLVMSHLQVVQARKRQ